MKARFDKLLSPGFLISISLLLLNDLLLKDWFHNDLTGKLSDFAGLFSFTLFWITIFPNYKKIFPFIIGAGFIFWKSSLTQPLIDGWNSLLLWRIDRVIDVTDLMALTIIPLANLYEARFKPLFQYRLASYALLVISLFAFTATVIVPNSYYYPNTKFTLPFNRETILDKMVATKFIKPYNKDEDHTADPYMRPFDVIIESRLCQPYQKNSFKIRVLISLDFRKNETLVMLHHIEIINNEICRKNSIKKNELEPTHEQQQEYLKYIFEKEFIDLLKYGD